MTRLLILSAALAILSAAAVELDPATEKFFHDAELENMKILVKEKDPDWRIKAATSLGGSRYPDANAALGAALSDVDPRVRAAAADALWKSAKNAEPARGPLQKALNDSTPEVVIRAAGALQVLGVPAAELAPARRRVLEAPGAASDARFLAARGLIGIETPGRLLPPMLAYLDEWAAPARASGRSDAARNNTELCAKALAALASTGDRALIEPLMAEVRRARHGHVVLLKTLSRFTHKPTGWTGLLLGQLAATDHNVRYEALSMLSHEKDETAVLAWVPPVAGMLRDANASVRSQALWTLGIARGLAAG
ncbi:MAG: HEAT repeat domain-containing protein, partial [Betaproteobacteria bacterium]